MELLGIKVRHTTFGVGTIVECGENYITVDFAERRAKFIYPDVFERFITTENSSIQAAIIKKIEEARTRTLASSPTQEAETVTPIVSPKTKKTKRIDEMFSEDYHAIHLARQPILTYQQVENQFDIKIAGFGKGINSTDTAIILISSIGKSGGKFVYHDKWTVDGDYLYSGEGKTGDQTMTKGNLAIKNARHCNKPIHLFVKFSPQEYYYQGVFELVNYIYEDEKDENGNSRKEYKFRLRKVAHI